MIATRYNSVCIESMAVHLPEQELTSAELEDRLAPLYNRLQIPFGTLDKLSGVKSRRLWPLEVMPSTAATAAAKLALEKMPFGTDQIGMVINTSVTRDYFEPATACLVHRNLGLPEGTIAFDISNACMGFSNGIMYLAQMIESGVVKAGMIVSGEAITTIIEATITQLLKDTSIGRDDILKILPTFTLGCGAVAYVLCHESISQSKHRIIGSVARSATDGSDLCLGNADYQLSDREKCTPLMYTESAKLMASAAKLGGRMFKDFSKAFNWTKEDIHHVFCHQVGKQVNEGFYQEMGLDYEKEFTIYKNLGNLVSAALPAALAIGSEEKNIKAGEKVLLTAYGSGLNSMFTGIIW